MTREEPLSKGDTEILRMVLAGRSYEAIASERGTVAVTIRTAMYRIRAELGCPGGDSYELLAQALNVYGVEILDPNGRLWLAISHAYTNHLSRHALSQVPA